MQLAYISLTGVIVLLGVLFGLRVYSSDKKMIVNKVFLAFSVFFGLWNIFDFLAYQGNLARYQLIINRIDFGIISSLIFFLGWFVNIFPMERPKIHIIIKYFLIIFLLIILSLSLFTPLIVKSVTIESWGSNITTGNLFALFAIFGTIITLFAIGDLIYKFIKSRDLQRQQIKYILYGFASLLVLNSFFNLLIPIMTKSFVYGRFGTYSAIFLVGFTAYAILKTHLFKMKVILTETAIVIINVILAIQIFSSKTIAEGLLRTIFLMIVIYGSMLLLRSVRNEIKQKEELQILAKKLDKANMDLEQLDEAKDNFLSMAAHELNTPIAAIEGYLSMILEENMGGKIPVKALGYLKNVFLSSKRLAGLVHDLLNVSRIESNRIHVVYAEAQIEETINQAIAEVKIKADEVGHKLTFEKPAKPLPKTYFDVPRIVEVIINIIGNAIKYTDPPGKIDVKCHADDGKIVVSIEDNGRGIPKEKYDHVFEKFTQVNVLTDQIKGSGLGMFISKNLVELHKGKLWFTSSVGKNDHGTTFYFSIPILKDKPLDPHEGEGALFQTGGKKPAGEAKEATPDAKEAPVETEAAKDTPKEEKVVNIAKDEKTNSIPEVKPAEDKTSDKETKPEQPEAADESVKAIIAEAEKKPTVSLNERLKP